MRVTITSVGESGQIGFETRYGRGAGLWSGEPPCVGESYVVELDLEFDEGGALPRSIEVLHGSASPSISTVRGRSVFIGQVERLDEHGVLMLRLGDSQLLLETDLDAIATPCWVRVGPLSLTLYDTNI